MTSPALTSVNPYMGLTPFGEGDSSRFFGRDKEVEEIVDRLGTGRLLAVIGVSGCGKSSLVRAGVIPVLRMGVATNLPTRWRISPLTPGNDPLGSLAKALAAPRGWPTTSFDLVEYMKGELGATESLLLIVDQFEELFLFRANTMDRDGGNASALFVNLLLNAVDQREVPVYVLLTMRTDYLGECAEFRGLPEALNNCYYLVPRTTRLQQQEAIERPLEQAGAAASPALVQRLLNVAAESPDNLPVLEHLLKRLWECWRANGVNGPIGLKEYEEIGGWQKALENDAEAVLKLFPSDEAGIRTLFQWITERGTGKRPIRRPRPFSECLEISGLSREVLTEVIRAFQGRGLIRPSELTDQSLIDLPHESLMWQWPRLGRWISEEAELAAQLRFLLRSAQQRVQLTGPALDSGLRWRERWRRQKLLAERYLQPAELKETEYWIGRCEDAKQVLKRSPLTGLEI
jgi:hypothetical protein